MADDSGQDKTEDPYRQEAKRIAEKGQIRAFKRIEYFCDFNRQCGSVFMLMGKAYGRRELQEMMKHQFQLFRGIGFSILMVTGHLSKAGVCRRLFGHCAFYSGAIDCRLADRRC